MKLIDYAIKEEEHKDLKQLEEEEHAHDYGHEEEEEAHPTSFESFESSITDLNHELDRIKSELASYKEDKKIHESNLIKLSQQMETITL